MDAEIVVNRAETRGGTDVVCVERVLHRFVAHAADARCRASRGQREGQDAVEVEVKLDARRDHRGGASGQINQPF